MRIPARGQPERSGFPDRPAAVERADAVRPGQALALGPRRRGRALRDPRGGVARRPGRRALGPVGPAARRPLGDRPAGRRAARGDAEAGGPCRWRSPPTPRSPPRSAPIPDATSWIVSIGGSPRSRPPPDRRSSTSSAPTVSRSRRATRGGSQLRRPGLRFPPLFQAGSGRRGRIPVRPGDSQRSAGPVPRAPDRGRDRRGGGEGRVRRGRGGLARRPRGHLRDRCPGHRPRHQRAELALRHPPRRRRGRTRTDRGGTGIRRRAPSSGCRSIRSRANRTWCGSDAGRSRPGPLSSRRRPCPARTGNCGH